MNLVSDLTDALNLFRKFKYDYLQYLKLDESSCLYFDSRNNSILCPKCLNSSQPPILPVYLKRTDLDDCWQLECLTCGHVIFCSELFGIKHASRQSNMPRRGAGGRLHH